MGLVLPQTVKVKWNSKIKKHYVDKGYVFTKMKDEFEVDVRDLTKGSEVKVKCVCDGCGEITYKFNKALTKELKINGKLYCSKCGRIRSKQTCLKIFGVEYPLQLEEIQKKRKQTCLKNLGVEYPLQLEEVMAKVKQTCLKNFGVEYPMQLEEIQEKRKQTCLNNFGVKNPMQLEEIHERQKQTCLKNFGVENPMQLEEIQEKAMETKIDRYGSNFGERMICGSSQQKHIHELIGGEYNYPFYGFFPDIALVDDKIAIEYDGTGHNLVVKYKKMTKEEFIQRELNKENKLFEEGWKIIRLVNEKTDKLPDDETIVNLINEKIHILKTTDTKKVVVKWS